MERSVGRVVEVEASVIVMERMWREPGRREGRRVAGREGAGLAINFGARSVAHMCTGYAFGKSEELSKSWIGREKLFHSSALRVSDRENLSRKKEKIYIYVCVYVSIICIKRSRFKIISLTCFTIFNYFRVVNARWIPD